MRQRKVNWETVQYDLYEANNKVPLLKIIDGGGAYDLRGFAQICLNGRRAWRRESVDSGTVVVGEPGSNAVAAYWSKLSGERLNGAKATRALSALRSVEAYGKDILKLPDIGGVRTGPYSASYSVGTTVQIASLNTLQHFMVEYKLHNALVPEQLKYADLITSVCDVGYYHGGDPVYTLENAGAFGWLEPCLRGLDEPGRAP